MKSISERIDNKLLCEDEKPKVDASQGFMAEVILKVVKRIYKGDSQLKQVLKQGYTIHQVIIAIKSNRCIANLGKTYLEQTIAGTIRDLIKDRDFVVSEINTYRKVFGLPPLSRSEIKNKVMSGIHQKSHNKISPKNSLIRKDQAMSNTSPPIGVQI